MEELAAGGAGGDFVYHVGDLDLSSDYLPPGFVRFALSLQPLLRILLTVLLPLLSFLVLLRPRLFRSLPGFPGLFLAATTFLLALPYHQFPDEVFVNLKQSKHLAENGRYSFEADRNVDGTGDLLFYVLVGGLHRTGIPSPLGALLLGGLFMAGAVLLLHRWTFEHSQSHRWAWFVTLGAMLLSSLGGLSGSGWSSSLIAFLTVLAIRLWHSPRWRWTFLTTGLLAIVRWDFAYYTGLLAAGLVWVSYRKGDRPWRTVARPALLSLLSIPAVLLFWKLYYGHFVPTCIVMKSGTYYSAEATREFLRSYISDLAPFLVVLFLGRRLTPSEERGSLFAWLLPGLLHVVLVLQGGGDYMPGHRYHIVLTTALVCAVARLSQGTGVALNSFFRHAPSKTLSPWQWALTAGFLVFVITDRKMDPFPGPTALKKGRTVSRPPFDRELWFKGVGYDAMMNSRINNHAFTGRFFSALEPKAKLASLEVASTFYFFDGRSLDVLGFVNRSVAEGPVHRGHKRGFDKRLDPNFWERERPELIWLDTDTEILPTMRLQPDRPALASILSWSRHDWWAAPYFREEYLHQNYRPRATLVNGKFLLLWLVRNDLAPTFDDKLASLGFQSQSSFP